MTRRLLLFLVSTLIIFPLAPGPAQNPAWVYRDGAFQPARLAAGAALLPRPLEADLDGDGRPESLSLVGRQARISHAGQVAWRSPDAWQVSSVQIADLDRDGRPEAVLLVWRPFQPWPVDRFLPHGGRIATFHNSTGLSCHLILIGFRRGGYRELWAGSALAEPLRDFAAVDLDGDGRQELAALESDYADTPGAPARSLTTWEWNGFGFTLLARQPGAFTGLQVASYHDQEILTTEH